MGVVSDVRRTAGRLRSKAGGAIGGEGDCDAVAVRRLRYSGAVVGEFTTEARGRC